VCVQRERERKKERERERESEKRRDRLFAFDDALCVRGKIVTHTLAHI
jgi:hypothetical protein